MRPFAVLSTAVVALSLVAVPLLADAPACVHYRGEARYRYPGYDHVVHIENGCARRALCAVSTNVDAEPISVTVEANSSREVITRRGSPAREFTPHVDCALESEPPD